MKVVVLRAKHKPSNHKHESDSLVTLRVTLCLKRIGGNEVVQTARAAIRKVQFLAASQVCKAIYYYDIPKAWK